MRGPDERRLEHEIWHPARAARSADAGGGNLAAVGITDDQQQQAEIASALMGLPFEEVLAEVKKTGRAAARSATRVITGEQGAQRSVVVERRVVRRFGNDKRTGT